MNKRLIRCRLCATTLADPARRLFVENWKGHICLDGDSCARRIARRNRARSFADVA